MTEKERLEMIELRKQLSRNRSQLARAVVRAEDAWIIAESAQTDLSQRMNGSRIKATRSDKRIE